ncbi:MAG TPA: hypothetical protein VN088_17605 [Nocardioides sp.]|nr:hypothetical protein [Nocardioides sp.]
MDETQGFDDVRMRIGVFCRPDGFSPVSTGWPFGRLTLGAAGVTVSAPGIVSAPVRRRFAWTELVAVDRTQHGVRFRFADHADTVVASTPVARHRHRLVEAARRYTPDGVVHDEVSRLHWWCWDPDE